MTDNQMREIEESKRRMAELQIDGSETQYEGKEYGFRRLLKAVMHFKPKVKKEVDNVVPV